MKIAALSLAGLLFFNIGCFIYISFVFKNTIIKYNNSIKITTLKMQYQDILVIFNNKSL